MNANTKPFREDFGLDDAGFHRIRMGNTVYCVKNNVIYILSADGRLNSQLEKYDFDLKERVSKT